MNTRREDQNLLKEAPEETAYHSNISLMQYIEEEKRVNTNVYHMNDSISLIYIYIYTHEYITGLTVCACVFVQCNWKRRGKIELYKIYLTSIDRLFILDH